MIIQLHRVKTDGPVACPAQSTKSFRAAFIFLRLASHPRRLPPLFVFPRLKKGRETHEQKSKWAVAFAVAESFDQRQILSAALKADGTLTVININLGKSNLRHRANPWLAKTDSVPVMSPAMGKSSHSGTSGVELKKSTVPRSLVIILQLWLVPYAIAANPAYDAKDEDFWNGTAFILVAKVIAVGPGSGSSPIYYKVTLEPRAIIAGLFNPAAHKTIVFEMALGFDRWTIPKADELIIAVLFDHEKLEVPGVPFGLAGGRCVFMPNNQPLVVLKDMNDPVIVDVLHKMQAARPTTAPSSPPSGPRKMSPNDSKRQ